MEKIEVRNIELLKSGGIKVNLAFNTTEFNTIVVKGFRVKRSEKNNDVWIQVPSYQSYGRYFPTFFIENAGTWKEVEGLLRDTFLNKEKELSINNLDEEINIDDLPI